MAIPDISKAVSHPVDAVPHDDPAPSDPLVPVGICALMLSETGQNTLADVMSSPLLSSVRLDNDILAILASALGTSPDPGAVMQSVSIVSAGLAAPSAVCALVLWLFRRGAAPSNIRRLTALGKMANRSAHAALVCVIAPLVMFAVTSGMSSSMAAALQANGPVSGPDLVERLIPLANTLAVVAWAASSTLISVSTWAVAAWSLGARSVQGRKPDDSCPFRSLGRPPVDE